MRKAIDGKHYPHTELHPSAKCEICKKPIKKRLVLIKEKSVRLCYKCYINKKQTIKDTSFNHMLDDVKDDVEKAFKDKLGRIVNVDDIKRGKNSR
jgi:ribosome-binding protein aMBF1 (putative translation factor)